MALKSASYNSPFLVPFLLLFLFLIFFLERHQYHTTLVTTTRYLPHHTQTERQSPGIGRHSANTASTELLKHDDNNFEEDKMTERTLHTYVCFEFETKTKQELKLYLMFLLMMIMILIFFTFFSFFFILENENPIPHVD